MKAVPLTVSAAGAAAPDEPPSVLRWPGAASRQVRLHDLEPGAGYAACVAALTDLPLRVRERTAGRR